MRKSVKSSLPAASSASSTMNTLIRRQLKNSSDSVHQKTTSFPDSFVALQQVCCYRNKMMQKHWKKVNTQKRSLTTQEAKHPTTFRESKGAKCQKTPYPQIKLPNLPKESFLLPCDKLGAKKLHVASSSTRSGWGLSGKAILCSSMAS